MTKRRVSWVVALLAGVALAPVPVETQAPQEPQAWVHVHIEGSEGEGNVAVNLPLRAVGAMLAMAPSEIISADGRLTVAEQRGLTVSEIRQIWQDVKDVGDVEFLTIEQDDETVRVSRAGEQIEVRVDSDDTTVRIDLPIAVVDALLSGDGETLNIAAAIEEIGTLRGDIVRVTQEARRIRVWVDEEAEQ